MFFIRNLKIIQIYSLKLVLSFEIFIKYIKRHISLLFNNSDVNSPKPKGKKKKEKNNKGKKQNKTFALKSYQFEN